MENITCINFNKLSNEEAQSLEGEINYSEALEFLKNMKNDKSPGSDGFTAEFLKLFWTDLHCFIIRSINYSYGIIEMSNTQKLGLITCIPKPNKPKHFLKNWRPITLLNCIYKIASGCIANRIKKVLDKIIAKDQTGFIKGRYIGENIRLIYDIMHYTEKLNIPGMLLLIDFEKAFDSLSWTFIEKALDLFNFKISIKNWIRTLYYNSTSRVLQNGFLSESIKLERGCRQGDPLSPYIFTICAEILAILIRNSDNIQGLKIDGEEFLISQYADDTTFILDGSPKSLENTLKTLDLYANVSGLHINYSKSQVIWIGRKKYSKEVFHHVRWKLKWGADTFEMLGIKFSSDMKQITKINYEQKIIEMKNLIKIWSIRKLTVLGRIVVFKSLIIPKITYLLISLPNPSEQTIQQIKELAFKFIWQNKPDRIKREILTQTYPNGGIKMLNIQHFMTALKSTWIRRLFTTNAKWKLLFEITTKLSVQKLVICGDYFIKIQFKKLNNSFWKDVLYSWWLIQQKQIPGSINELIRTNIWHNNKITVDHKPIFYEHYIKNGVIFIQDLIDEQGQFLTLEMFRNKYNLCSHFLEYASLVKAVKKYIYDTLSITNIQNVIITNPIFPFKLQLFLITTKGCKEMYNILNKSTIIPTAQTKYSNLGYMLSAQEWRNVYKIPFQCLKDPTLLWFQYRILHRIITTNTFLYKIKYIESNICDLCHSQPETLEHLFFDCPKVLDVWKETELWIQDKGEHINFDKQTVLFGIFNSKGNKTTFANWLIINVKYYIYVSKMQKIKPSIYALLNIIKDKIHIEKYILYKNCQFEEFEKYWAPWSRFLETRHVNILK